MEENDIVKSLASFNLTRPFNAENGLVLRLEKAGSLYTASYSLDGLKFEILGTTHVLLRDIRAGLIACDGVVSQYMKSTFWFDPSTGKPDTPLDFSFDYFRIKNSGSELGK